VFGTSTTLLATSIVRLTPGAIRLSFGRIPGAHDVTKARTVPLASVALRPHDLAAIVHTSGATGPAKAVAYTHKALVAQRSPIELLTGDSTAGGFTTSFAAFSLLAPTLERSFIRPDVAIDQPSKLGFDELLEVTQREPIHVAWLSPASARQLVATAKGRKLPLSKVLLAGAPIPPELVTAVQEITQGVVLSPYGMTECLPITTGVGAGEHHHSGGVVVGAPIDGAIVWLRDLLTGERITEPGPFGEVLVHAPWMYAFYDQRHQANLAATVMIDGVRFHATGDIGLFDGDRLVILGRLRDVLHTATDLLAPLTVEDPVRRALRADVAAVGIGPRGSEVVVIVVGGSSKRLKLAPEVLANSARTASPVPLAAVLVGRLPVDHRHQSKVDHAALKAAAQSVLSGP